MISRWNARFRAWIYILDGFLVGLALLGVYRQMSRARLPAMFIETEVGFVVSQNLLPDASNPLLPGDILKAIDGDNIFTNNEIEFLSDHHLPGDIGDVLVIRNGQPLSMSVPLVRFYTDLQVLSHAVVSGLYIVIGLLVFIKRRHSSIARVFHWLVILVALKTVTAWASYEIRPALLGYMLQWIDLTANAFIPALAIHFSFIFPRRKSMIGTRMILLPYALGTILLIGMSITFAASINPADIVAFRKFIPIYNLTRWLLSISFVIVGLNLVHSYVTAQEDQDRRKILWVVPGLVIGPMTYIILWIIPLLLISRPLIPVELLMLSLALFPITFAISIIRYNAFDIVLLFNRSTVATLVLGVSFSIYALIIGLVTSFVQQLTVQSSIFASGAAAGIVVLIFEPTRRMVTQFVNKTFFRTRYGYQTAAREIIQKLPKCVDTREIAMVVTQSLAELLNLERIGFFGVSMDRGNIHLLDQRNMLEIPGGRLPMNLKNTLPISNRPLAVSKWVELDADTIEAPESAFNQMGITIGSELLSDSNELFGIVLLGPKKSGAKYTKQDADFLDLVGAQTGLAIDRIFLNQRLVLEQAESQRLEELNRMKSYFVSSVSHDLKTPLTSIRLFAELMRTGQLPDDKVIDYCKIIEGESDRLTRLINNVLDFAKIEKGIKEYQFSEIDLNGLVDHVLKSMEYQFRMNEFEVKQDLSSDEIVVHADSDAIIEVLVNLLANSMKFVDETRVITVATYNSNSDVHLKVQDEGIGIPLEQQAKIFEPFTRAVDEGEGRPPGTGLGLSVVKHVMEAHKGTIQLQSAPGEGSTFILVFPSEGAQA